MEITTKITDSNIRECKFIQSNNVGDYFFIDAYIVCEIEYADKKASFELQTGHTYRLNEYSLPSNSLTIYADSCKDALINEIYAVTVYDLESQDTVDSINEECETSYSISEMIDIHLALIELEHEACQIIKNAEYKADEDLKNDTNIYVEQQYIETDEETGIKHQYDLPDVIAFDNEYEASEYISNNVNSNVISKESAKILIQNR